MAIVFADKVKVRSYSTGTAEFTLETTVPGFQSFAAIGAGNECYYGIEDAAGNWEVGRGTYDTDSTQELLFRDTVISSSNSNNLVNFPAGGKSVFVTIPSSVASSIVDSTASDSFSTIEVAGQSTVVADSSTDTLTLVAGTGIDITTTASTDTITIANNLLAVGQNIIPAIDSDGTTGYTLGSASYKWKELFVSNGSIYIGDIKLSNVGGKLAAVKVINPGEENETEDPEDSDAASEISGGGLNGVSTSIPSNPNAGDEAFVLTLNTANEDTPVLIKVYETDTEVGDEDAPAGPAISIGANNGGSHDNNSIAIGNDDVGYDQDANSIAIGYQAGWGDDSGIGENAIAIGHRAAYNSAPANSITLNATGVDLSPDESGLFIKPIRSAANAKALYYNTTSGEITYDDPTGSSVDNNIWIETFTTNDIEGSIVQIATSVEYDADGNIFTLFSHLIPGEAQETYKSVAKLTPTGSVLWQVRFGANLNTDGWGLAYDGGDSVYIAGSTSGTPLTYNLATLTKIDAADGSIVWSKTYDFAANSRSAVVDVDSDLNPVMVGWADTPGEENNRIITTKVDQADGSVVWSRTLDGQGDDEAYGMAVGPAGEVVAVGYMSQYDEVLASHPVTPLTGSGVNRLVINRSDLSNDTFTDTWQVAGTGITGTIGVSQINAYTGLTGTVQEGSGAVFDIVDNGDETYSASIAIEGTNYLAGHKIKILGTALGGATPDNDCIITVDVVDAGAIIGVSNSGTAAGGTSTTYQDVAGSNYQTGSGLEFDLELDSGSTYTEHPFNITAAGINYVDGDVVVIPGTQLGGTTPTNDLIATVSTSAGGVTQFNSFTGTQQTTTYRIITEDFDIDFSDAGGEVTALADWVGDGLGGWDQTSYTNLATTGGTGSGLTVDVAAGGGYIDINSITINTPGTGYTTGDVITIDNENNFPGTFTITATALGAWTLTDISTDTDDRMIVVKYAANGTIAWQKAVEFDSNYDCRGADADIDADGNIYVCGSYDNAGGSAMSLVKFNSSGVAQWSRQVIGNCQDFATSVVVSPDNNLYLSGVTIDDANEDIVWVVAKYSTGGTVVWQRLIDNTASWTFSAGFFVGNGGGSNIAVRNGYVALAGGFGTLGPNDPTATVVQIDTNGTPFSIGDWELTGASFSGELDDTASSITVVDAGKTSATATPAVEDFVVMDDDSSFLEVTRYSLAGGNTGNITFEGVKIIGREEDDKLGMIRLVPAKTGTVSDGGGDIEIDFEATGQFVNIYPTNAGDVPHIHIAAGSGIEGSGDLMLGDDNKYVEINRNGYVGIATYDSESPSYHYWQFGNDGILTIPSQISATEGQALRLFTTDAEIHLMKNPTGDVGIGLQTSGDDVEITNSGNSWRFDTDGKFSAPDEVYGNFFTLRGGQAPGESIGNLGYAGDYPDLYGTAGVRISTGEIEQGPFWQYGADGNITFPDDTVQTTAYTPDIPQVVPAPDGSSGYMLQTSDRGRHILIDGSVNTIIVPLDTTDPLPIGSTIVLVLLPGPYDVGVVPEDEYEFLNIFGAGVGINEAWIISAGTGGAMATLIKVSDNSWMLSGTGLAVYGV